MDYDPVENNKSLIITKKDTFTQHGLGLKNIRDIADKHDGFLRSEYKGWTVYFCCFAMRH